MADDGPCLYLCLDDPDNILLLDLWYAVYDQQIIGPQGAIGLNMAVLPLVFDAYEVSEPFDKKWLIRDLKSIMCGFLTGR